MDKIFKIWSEPPKGLNRKLRPKYFVHGKNEKAHAVLSVVVEEEGELFGFVEQSNAKNLVGKVWSVRSSQLQELLLGRNTNRKWEVSMNE